MKQLLNSTAVQYVSGCNEHTQIVITRKRKRSSSPSKNNSPKVTEDLQTSISQLLDHVPEVNDLFTINGKIGEGTFSSVYLGSLKKFPYINQQFALKHITPTSHPDRVSFELFCLQTIGGVDNVMGTKLCLRNKDHVVMVMPYFQHDRFQDYIHDITVSDVRDYMYNLLLALRQVHSYNIIHRDVKPSNFLYNRKLKKYALVDFGLAHVVPSSNLMEEIQEEVEAKTRSASISTALSKPRTSPSKRRSRSVVSYSENQVRCSIDRRQPVVLASSACLTERNLNTYNPRISNARHDHLQRRRESGHRIFKSPKSSYNKPPITTQKPQSMCRKSRGGSVSRGQCSCFGMPKTCTMCMSRTVQVAARAGTPGFRPPEVLMKYQKQTTAVDIWSAGVIFLSLLSGRYPFFRAPDDMTALAQIISIMGTKEMKQAASNCGKNLVCSPSLPALSLKTLCERLRRASTTCKSRTPQGTKGQEASKSKRSLVISKRISPSTRKPSSRLRSCVPQDQISTVDRMFPESCYDLLTRLLDLNPLTRITAEEALLHPFLITNHAV